MKDKFNYLVKMKTKLISLMWRGSVSVDPRFSAVMLPWSIVDIRNRELYNKVIFWIIFYYQISLAIN